MGNLRIHAERELKLSGVDEDIYGDMTSKAVLELIDVFSNQGHSGMSGSLVLQLFSRLVQFENLTALTNNPEEWQDVGGQMWQSRRNSECFSQDGGNTYYKLSEGRTPGGMPNQIHTSEPHKEATEENKNV